MRMKVGDRRVLAMSESGRSSYWSCCGERAEAQCSTHPSSASCLAVKEHCDAGDVHCVIQNISVICKNKVVLERGLWQGYYVSTGDNSMFIDYLLCFV